ncbi:MAG: hypothetical protein ACHQ17_03860 [Polyangia bacterium]|jgi:hypothetical protein
MRFALGLFGALLLLAGCGATTPPPQTPASSSAEAAPAANPSASPRAAAPSGPAVDLSRWKNRAVSPECRRDLAALAAGEFDAFHGLPRCGRVDAEGTLGASGEGPSQFEKMGEYRVFSSAGKSAIAYFLADDIRVVELLYPKLDQPLSSLLGPPEGKVKSELSPGWDQWVYASRGLTAHVNRKSGEVIAVFAYPATTVDAFLKTDIARVSKSEAPLEELK